MRRAARPQARPQADGDDPARTARSRAGTTCSGRIPGLIGVKTGHTDHAGWSRGRRRAARGRRRLRGRPRQPHAGEAERRPRRSCSTGASTSTRASRSSARASATRRRRSRSRTTRSSSSSPRGGASEARPARRRLAVRRARRRARRWSSSRSRKGQKLGEVVVHRRRREVARVDLVATRDIAEPSLEERAALVRRPRPRRGRRHSRLARPGLLGAPRISARIAPVPSPHPVG